MYSGEMEIQAKRKTLAVLHDEVNRILNSSRELSQLVSCLTDQKDNEVQRCIDKMKDGEEEVKTIKSKITREVAEIGSLMLYREDVLRTAYIIDDIAGYISGTAFRLSNIKPSTLQNGNLDIDLKELIGMAVDLIFKLNEMTRALSINPAGILDLAHEVQRLEKEVDAKYRNMIINVLNEITSNKDLLLLKDAIEGIEGMADKCQEASDSLTILAMSI
ncbi:MAG: DUF47 domain-containing protein [Nitrososphaeraceae archaeon]|nr:DUF47 domain-containing protein [Nitrososphaeraceae archaeon]